MSPRKAWYGARTKPRGLCPLCGKNVAVLQDGRVAVRHDKPDGSRCKGQGEKALPLPGGEA